MSMKTLQMTDQLYDYLLHIDMPENIYMAELRQKTYELRNAVMITSREQDNFFMFLLRLLQPKFVLEVGTFTGYCTLALALATSEDCKVITCDIDADYPAVGKPFWQKAGVAHKIDLRIRPALETLAELKKQNMIFDFVFLDADKVNYQNYFDAALDMLAPKGVIAVDNVLWDGKVADPSDNNYQTRAIRKFNDNLRKSNLHYCVLPVGDGLTLVSK